MHFDFRTSNPASIRTLLAPIPEPVHEFFRFVCPKGMLLSIARTVAVLGYAAVIQISFSLSLIKSLLVRGVRRYY